MGKYNRLSGQAPPPPPPWKIHPIWRGIGCILFLVGPIIAYIVSDLLVQMAIERRWLPVPPELSRVFYYRPMGLAIPHFYGNLMVTALLLLLGVALIMVLYTLIYALAGPPRYSPLDSPPIRRKTGPSR